MPTFRAIVGSLIPVVLATPAAAGVESLPRLLSQAREVQVRRLATRFEWHGHWNADSASSWARRATLGNARLTTRQRALLAHALADSIVPRPPMWHRSEFVDAEDCDFLLSVQGPTGSSTVLLSFPESQARWLDSDSVLRVVRFEGHAFTVIEVLRRCFPHDSTVQDLPAAVGWFLHNPIMTGDGDGVIPYYEDVPKLITKVPCVYSHVGHASGSFMVWIEALIDRNGVVRLARVKRGVPKLNEAALNCVRRYQYRPASFEGHPFGFRLVVPVTFRFE